MKVLLSGGGTIGSVSPLLAVAERMLRTDFLFIGTKRGPERKIVEKKNMRFKAITAGKFRQYWDFRNFIDIFKIGFAFWQALFLLIKEKPAVIVSAGSFVSVPLVWAGWILRIPSVIHSQDIVTGLAIKLMKPFASKITKLFADASLKAEAVGNPVRSLDYNTNVFQLKEDKPLILITGGSTGALAINKLITKDLLYTAQVIHVTGKNKKVVDFQHPDYHIFEFLKKGLEEAFHKADVIIARAGLSTLTELSALGKPVVIIPMPDSHQEINAKYFADHQAAVVLDQKQLTPEKLNQTIRNLLTDKDKLQNLSENIKKIVKPNAAETLAKIIQHAAKGA